LVDPAQLGIDRSTAHDVDLPSAVLYELHIGTFSEQGTFAGAIEHLDDLVSLGVTGVELMPIEEERGERGWGYGPVHQFAVRRAYGGPSGLAQFVNAAHSRGLAVLLDVVYNHWSTPAMFLERFGPYFHATASTPWGPTPNVDGPGADEVRRYLFDNARLWLEDYIIDGFRLDAVHEIYDRSSLPFWAEFSEVCHAIGGHLSRRPVLIAESDLNDTKILRPPSAGGWGLDAQWADDFHHAVHAALTGERLGYYADFGSLDQLARAFERPFRFEGDYSLFRKKTHGSPVGDVDPFHFVVFDQNHDQVGNRGDGARLTTLLSPGLARVALGLLLFAPYVPMLFMGEEYGERRPFYFFADPPFAFTRRVVQGRLRQLRSNGFTEVPPNPVEPSTQERCRLDWVRAASAEGVAHRRFVTVLLALRRDLPALHGDIVRGRGWDDEHRLEIRRSRGSSVALLLANLGPNTGRFELESSVPWTVLLRSDELVPERSVPAVARPAESPFQVSPESFAILGFG
jgi:maltooligosyltrehalose trehalohydrolase